jgi:hypothetical protein
LHHDSQFYFFASRYRQLDGQDLVVAAAVVKTWTFVSWYIRVKQVASLESQVSRSKSFAR